LCRYRLWVLPGLESQQARSDRCSEVRIKVFSEILRETPDFHPTKSKI
jgi:hypothetical protein